MSSFKEKIMNALFEPIEEMEETVENENIFFEETEEDIVSNVSVAEAINEIIEAPQPTVISKSSTIGGDIRSEGDLTIYGEVRGNVFSDRNVIINGGKVKGSVTAQNVQLSSCNVEGDVKSSNILDIINNTVVNGNINGSQIELNATVNGDVKCNGYLRLSSGGNLNGNISTVELEIVRGSQFEGFISAKKV